MLFNKDKHATLEVYNDINSNLVNLFRCIKHHNTAMKEELEYAINSREIFNELKEQDIKYMTDIQKAVRYLYLIRASYGCKVDTWGSSSRNVGRSEDFVKIKKRLEKVIIENKSFDKLIKQYDREHTLFYCDHGCFGEQ